MKTLLIALVVAWTALAGAGTPALVAHDAGTYSISLPKGWTVVDNAAQGMVVAQQDPKKKDAAQLLVIVSANAQGTADQLLDAIVKNGLADAKVQKREALPDGASKLLVADGKAEGVAARLGAIAIVNSGMAVICVLISKTGDFDALGGTSTVVAVLGSLKIAAAATTTQTAPSSKSSEVMEPTYDSYNNLIVPPPRRAITQADLVGEWKNTGKSVKGYVNTSTGGYAGYSAVVSEKTWVVDAKAGLRESYNSVHVSNNGGGTFQASGDNVGTLTIASDRVLTYTVNNRSTLYLLRGWFVGPELTVMRVNGPYWNVKDLDADTRADKRGYNLDEMWVRKTR